MVLTNIFTLRMFHLELFHLLIMFLFFAMFEALHSFQNRLKSCRHTTLFQRWYEVVRRWNNVVCLQGRQVKYMQRKDFTLPGGFKVKVFLNGNFKMLDLVMGHQTSATYPSIKNLTVLSHLKTHGGTPHTLENCRIELKKFLIL